MSAHRPRLPTRYSSPTPSVKEVTGATTPPRAHYRGGARASSPTRHAGLMELQHGQMSFTQAQGDRRTTAGRPCTTDGRFPLATRISSLVVRPSGPTDGSPAAGILDGAAVGSTVCAKVVHAVGDAVGDAVGAADISADRSAAVAAVITIGYSRGVTDSDADNPDSLVVTRRATFSLRAMLHSRPPARGSCWGRTRAWPGKGQSRSEEWGTRGDAKVERADVGAKLWGRR